MQISDQMVIDSPTAHGGWGEGRAAWPGATSSPAAAASWRRRLAAGEREWRSLAIAFAAYWAMFVVGAYTNHPELNNVGAIFILAALFVAASGRLGVKADAVAIACVAAASASLLAMWLSGQLTHFDAVIKQISLYLVMALSRLLRLPPAYRSRIRGVFAVQILIVLALSFVTDRSGVWDGGSRHSGLFANPNNLALIPFLLLFFVDRRRDSLWIQAGAHAIVIAVLLISRTSGAVIGYAIGLTIFLWYRLQPHWRPVMVTGAAIAGLIVAALAFSGESLLPETRLTKQIGVMRSDIGVVLNGGQISYWTEEKALGPGAASGIWRLVHWRDTLKVYEDGSPFQWIFGFGMGSSPELTGKLPHNDYLRVLFEQGVAGLVCFLVAWTLLIRRAAPDVRYCGVILAIYSFSENNLDNFPFMSLFVLCLSANAGEADGLSGPEGPQNAPALRGGRQ